MIKPTINNEVNMTTLVSLVKANDRTIPMPDCDFYQWLCKNKPNGEGTNAEVIVEYLEQFGVSLHAARKHPFILDTLLSLSKSYGYDLARGNVEVPKEPDYDLIHYAVYRSELGSYDAAADEGAHYTFKAPKETPNDVIVTIARTVCTCLIDEANAVTVCRLGYNILNQLTEEEVLR